MQDNQPEQPAPEGPTANLPVIGKNPNKKKLLIIVIVAAGVALLGVGAGLAFWHTNNNTASDSARSNNSQAIEEAEQQAQAVEGLQLDPAKNYGDKYKNGILPVGDNNYVTDAAKKGSVYMCNANFVPASQAGAQSRGPWFIGATQWDINKKYSVRGSVKWAQSITVTINGEKRTIVTNNLPDHVTGTFPVSASDPAYAYDRNPNTIKAQSLTYDLAANPAYGTPKCMGGEVGVMLSGSAIFNAFDAGGRDAGAWEIQDGCEGHPQSSGLYHYHTLSSCVNDVGVGTVIGYALDGFPITGPKLSEGNLLTTTDLDECHGIVSDITLDGKKTKMYHYVMTQDFPYSVSCFRGTAIQPPGQHTGGQQQQGGMQQAGGQQQGLPPPPKN